MNSSMRRLLRWSLLGVIAVSIFAVVRHSESVRPGRVAIPMPSLQTSEPTPPRIPRKTAVTEPVSVAVYYFHGFARCVTCRKLEEYSHAAVTEGFSDEVRKGRMTFSAVNIEEPENAHFVQDYGLSSKTLVIQKQRGGKNLEWRNLDRIWQLVGDREAFSAYVRGEITALRGGDS